MMYVGSFLCCPSSTPESEVEWNRGCVMASAQNFARELKETPSNLLTPSLFVEAVGERLGSEAIQNLDFIPRCVCVCVCVRARAPVPVCEGV